MRRSYTLEKDEPDHRDFMVIFKKTFKFKKNKCQSPGSLSPEIHNSSENETSPVEIKQERAELKLIHSEVDRQIHTSQSTKAHSTGTLKNVIMIK